MSHWSRRQAKRWFVAERKSFGVGTLLALWLAFVLPVSSVQAQSSPASDVVAVPLPEGLTPKYMVLPGPAMWPSRSMEWRYNHAGAPSSLTPAAVVDVIQGALNKWGRVCNFTATYGGPTNGVPFTRDNENVVGWGNTTNPANTSRWFMASTGFIVEADVMLSPAYIDPAEIDAIMTHEGGHLLGLEHSDVQNAVMAGPPLTSYNTLDFQRTLRADDIAGCVALYGAALPPPDSLPACMVTASAATATAGEVVSLTASCTNHPTSYLWAGCASTTSTCQATQTTGGTTVYYVYGVNEYGTGYGYGGVVSVDWKPWTRPDCTVTTSNPTPVVGTTITLTATCSNNPTSYVWSNCTSATNTCQTTQGTPGASTYSVAGVNASGLGTAASAAANWQPVAVGLPSCTIVTNFGTLLLAGMSGTMTASCINNPTTWLWTGPCTPIGNGSSCSATMATPGTAQFTLVATNATGPGNLATIELTWKDAATPGIPPTCQLTTSDASPLVGATIALTANCTNEPTGYAWMNCFSTTGTCAATSQQPGTVTYSVFGQNQYGRSASTSVTVTWQDASTAAPSCTLTAYTLFPVVGNSLPLTANCSGLPINYTWSNCGSTGPTCRPTSFSAGTQTYTVMARNAVGSSAPASLTVTWLPSSSVVGVAEYYNASLDHYFMTANPAEIALLNNHVLAGWEPTGQQWPVYASDTVGPPGLTPVCRFYGDPLAGLDSHFYSASPAECEAVRKNLPQWLFESENVFQVVLPNSVNGACPPEYRPLFRTWNKRMDSNHRYTADVVIQNSMVNSGYVAEGYGYPPVVMCVLR